MRAVFVLCSTVAALVLVSSSNVHAQAKSAVQFWDTLGGTETAKMGWSGTAANGRFFVSIPGDTEIVKVEKGVVTVKGAVNATSLTGVIAPTSHVHPQIGTIEASLTTKSAIGHTHKGSEISDSVPLSKISTVGAKFSEVLTYDGTKADWQPIASTGSAGVDSLGSDSGLVVSPKTGAAKISIGGKAVRTGMLADSAVTGLQLKSKAVNPAHINPSATAGQVLSSTGTTVAWTTPVTLVGSGTASTASRSDHGHTGYQASNTHLDDLADGTLSGSLVDPDFGAAQVKTTGGLLFPTNTEHYFRMFPSVTSGGVSFLGIHKMTNTGGYGNVLVAGSASSDPFDNAVMIEGDLTLYRRSDTRGFIRVEHKTTSAVLTLTQDASFGHIQSSTNLNLSPAGGKVYLNDTELHTSSSDRRLKQDIRPIGPVLSKLDSIQPVYFRWKQDQFTTVQRDTLQHIGIIAQDVEAQFPEVVSKDLRGFSAVEYDKLTAVLIEAVREQKRIVDSYESRLRAAEERIAELEERLQ